MLGKLGPNAFRFALMGALLLAPVSSTTAQRTGTRIGKDAGPRDAVAVFRQLAQCVVDRQPNLINAWLVTLPGSEQEQQVIHKLEPDLPACLDSDHLVMDGRTLRFSPMLLREALAELAVERFSSLPQARPAQMTAEPWFSEQLKIVDGATKINLNRIALLEFGHCTAFQAWTETVTLLKSKAGEADETAALTALKPVLGPCLPVGSTIKLDRSTLRSMLAEAVWHVARPS